MKYDTIIIIIIIIILIKIMIIMVIIIIRRRRRRKFGRDTRVSSQGSYLQRTVGSECRLGMTFKSRKCSLWEQCEEISFLLVLFNVGALVKIWNFPHKPRSALFFILLLVASIVSKPPIG